MSRIVPYPASPIIQPSVNNYDTTLLLDIGNMQDQNVETIVAMFRQCSECLINVEFVSFGRRLVSKRSTSVYLDWACKAPSMSKVDFFSK